ncbi:hypothetical protein ACJJTC_008164 [Scirpophaga incertulas]
MAALSCYQPCRSHLAQPARCFNEDENRKSSATLSLRRRQFVEQSHESRNARRGDLVPDVSVKRTREELAKHASQTLPLTRRLNVESGWSKVEEVRKKFEGASTVPSYSRSFESPPRRRLADSLFASFKLPRKKDGMSASRSLAPQPQQKRKSAVELLAETKAFYVKSETVLDRKQELPLRMSSGLGQAIASGGCHLVSSGNASNDACCSNSYAASRSLGSSRRSASAGDGLQDTLRRLLEHSDSRETVYSPTYTPHKSYTEARRAKESYPGREHPAAARPQHSAGNYSGTSSSSGSKPKHDTGKMNRPLSFGDARVFFPESFVIPRQRAAEVVVQNPYSLPSSHSSPEHMELPDPVVSGSGSPQEQVGAISPPAQYAHSAPRYGRSNSHSQPSVREDEEELNINSHKSLPDLHAQARGYTEHHNSVAPEAMGSMGRSSRRRRHSSHQRAASCSSKGTSRCGSGFARDSGGSSGHYTQRSAPPHARRRTDSGSSTQHDHHSRYNSYGEEPAELPLDVYPSAPPQFQDGPSSPQAQRPHATRSGIHFQESYRFSQPTSAPPPQFQDDPPVYDYGDYECAHHAPCVSLCHNAARKDFPRYHEPAQTQYQETRRRARIEETNEYVHAAAAAAAQMCPQEEVTSPLGTFKRQRCLRYKQRHPRPILRSKSDISDRYRRGEGRSEAAAAADEEQELDPEEILRLAQFFERLGLEPRQFEAIARDPPPESPVFFSSASTIDSNQLAAAADYTVQGPGTPKQGYRNTEPPSVVERNARIIKWLCQCRKTQHQHQQQQQHQQHQQHQ